MFRVVTPLLLPNDYAYMAIMLLFSLTNGYLGSICLMSAPQVRRKTYARMCVVR